MERQPLLGNMSATPTWSSALRPSIPHTTASHHSAPPTATNVLNSLGDEDWGFLDEFSKIMGTMPDPGDQPQWKPLLSTGTAPGQGVAPWPTQPTPARGDSSFVTQTPAQPKGYGTPTRSPPTSKPGFSEISFVTSSTFDSPTSVLNTSLETSARFLSPPQSTPPPVRDPLETFRPATFPSFPVANPPGPALPIRRKSRKPQKKFKNYSAQNPSRFCHICAKNRLNQPSLVCTNVKNLLCQKAVCRKCFFKRGWDWEDANKPESKWLCPHCRGVCPRQARCFVYGRANKRRSERRAAAEGDSDTESGSAVAAPGMQAECAFPPAQLTLQP